MCRRFKRDRTAAHAVAGRRFADTYHWKNGIGKREDRPVTYNENFGTFEVDHNQFGTHEFMEFCEMLGAKPWLGVNVLSGSVGEMRDWVDMQPERGDGSVQSEERKRTQRTVWSGILGNWKRSVGWRRDDDAGALCTGVPEIQFCHAKV